MGSTNPYSSTYRSWDATGRTSTSYPIRLSRGRSYDLVVGEMFCATHFYDKVAVGGIFHEVLDWNGDLLLTQVVAAAFYGVIENAFYGVIEKSQWSSSKNVVSLIPTVEQTDTYYFLFEKDMKEMNARAISIPHIYRLAVDRNEQVMVGRFFFNPRDEYDMLDRMSYEEMLISPFRWVREWPTINSDNRLLYDVDPVSKE